MRQSICFLGDSIAKGVMYDAQKNRYIILKECFANRVADHLNASVKNLSKFGSTVTDGMRRFQKQSEELVECKKVIVGFGGNDSDFLWSEVSEQPDIHHDPKTVLDVFCEQYSELISEIRRSGRTPFILNLPPVDHKRYFAWISRDLNADNILKWLGGSSEFIYRWHERYNIAVHKIAQSADVRLIDIRSSFLKRRDYSRFLSADGIHPNAEGHELITQAIIEST